MKYFYRKSDLEIELKIMKVFTILIIFCFLFLNLSCQNQTVLSQKNENSQLPNNLQNSNQTTESTSDKEDGLDIDELVADTEVLIFNDYKIKKIITKKKDEDDSPEADIEDAVLEKNGKRLLRFEGVYYPAGNWMQFSLFSLTRSKNKDLIVCDRSNRFGRLWIVNFDNEAKQIFDSDDWDGFREWITFVDFEKDGIYEFTMAQYNYAGFKFLAHIDTPIMLIIFKYNQISGKYLPANYKYQDHVKEIIEKQDREEVKNNLTFRPMLENFLGLMYAGMETEAWEYFEKNYNFHESYEKGLITNTNDNRSKNQTISEETKQKVRIQIENSLKKDKIYQFVKNEVNKNN